MNFREIFLYRYHLRETNFCFTAINFVDNKWLNRTSRINKFNAGTYSYDKIWNRLNKKR